MLWFTVWAVLVGGTLVGAFFLGRRLWRSALGLGRALGRAGTVAGELADRADELARAAAERRPDTAATLFGDAELLRADVRRLRDERALRRAERERELLDVAHGWRSYWT